MKKLALTVLGLICINNAHGADVAKLNMHLSGNIDSHYYLCVSNSGCVSVKAGEQGFVFPLTPGKIQHIFLSSSADFRMYPQAIPNSCQVEVNGNQTLHISGTIVKNGTNNVNISNLSCSVS